MSVFEETPIPDPVHHVSLVRVYDEEDNLDMEIVTGAPHVFSVTFGAPRTLKAFSIEPGAVPVDKSFLNR